MWKDKLLEILLLLQAEDKTMHCRMCNRSPRFDLKNAIKKTEELLNSEE